MNLTTIYKKSGADVAAIKLSGMCDTHKDLEEYIHSTGINTLRSILLYIDIDIYGDKILNACTKEQLIQIIKGS